MDYKKVSLGLFLIALAYYISMDRFLASLLSTVESAICKKKGTRYMCNVVISYYVNGSLYTNKLNNVTQKTPLEQGDKIPVFYNPIDPMTIQYGYTKLIVSSILLATGCYIIYLQLCPI